MKSPTKQNKEKKVKVTERGFAGHFICASMCLFRRNTLIEFGNKRVVVSSVGNYRPHSINGEKIKKESQQIGCDRYYETMAFKAKKDGVYWEAEVSSEFPFESKWAINTLEEETDLEADEMHDNVVKEIISKLTPTK